MISDYVLNPAIVLTRDWLASRPGGGEYQCSHLLRVKYTEIILIGSSRYLLPLLGVDVITFVTLFYWHQETVSRKSRKYVEREQPFVKLRPA